MDPSLSPGTALESALDRTGVEPERSLLLSVCDHFNSSPKLLKSVLFWAEKKKPGILSSVELLNATISSLAKLREFESAWQLILSRLDGEKGTDIVSVDTFAMMIRRYTRAGMLYFSPLLLSEFTSVVILNVNRILFYYGRYDWPCYSNI